MFQQDFLVDTNVMIRWVQPNDPGFLVASQAINRLVRKGAFLCYTSQNLGEFWNSMTRPIGRNGFGESIEEANRLARQVEERLKLLPDHPAIHHEWRKMLVDHNISGVQVHDARLAAAMRVHGVKHILTFNTRDFARFPDLQAMHPANLQ